MSWNIKNIFSKSVKNATTSMAGGSISEVMQKLYNGTSADISEITYFTCLRVLSESMGKMPCYIEGPHYEHVEKGSYGNLSKVLQVAPNNFQTATEFFALIEKCRNHYGNGYAYIKYAPNGQIEGLYPLNPSGMSVYINDTEQLSSVKYWYQYVSPTNGKQYILLPDDVLHVKNWLTEPNGYVGKPTREILNEYMTGNKRSQEFLNDLYKNGMSANLAIKFVGNMSTASQEKVITQLSEFLKNRTDRILPIPSTWEIQPLDVKLTDSQFLEIKRYSAGAIAAAFGLPPNFLNDYTKSSFASSAAQNVSFYVNTLLYIISCYEQEFSKKLLTSKALADGYRIKFDFGVILRADPTSQASQLSTLVNSGVMSINEARANVGLPPVNGGDVNVVNGGCVNIDNLEGSQE